MKREIKLANPRGFCAGVDRAIEIVNQALLKFGPPVYVRHEVVHNRNVVEDLKSKGAIFVEQIDEIPEGAITIFSAHGVSKKVVETALKNKIHVITPNKALISKHGDYLSKIAENKKVNLEFEASVGGGIPILRTIYSAITQMTETFTKTNKEKKNVVLVEYPRKGSWAVGFATKDNKGEISKKVNKQMINVFVPTTPNPTSGFLLMYPKDEVIYLDMSFEEASKFIVSAGTSDPSN